MSTTLDQLFGLKNMTSLVELHASQAQNTRLQGFFSESNEFVFEGDSAEWDQVSYSRGLAPAVDRDGEAIATKGQDKLRRIAGMATFKMKEFIPASDIIFSRALGGAPNVRETAPLRVMRAVRGLTNRLLLTKEKLAADALAGSITIDPATYAGSEVTYPAVTYGVGSFTATTAWSTASTKILSASAELLTLKRVTREASGDDLGEVTMNGKTMTYILGNTEVQSWIQTTAPGARVFESGQLGAGVGMGGVPIWGEYDGGYKPDGGSYTRFIPDDKIIALPRDRSTAGLYWARGYVAVPNPRGLITGSAMDVAPVRSPSPGFFSYAVASAEPVGFWVFVGWRGFPIITNPAAVVYGDVTP